MELDRSAGKRDSFGQCLGNVQGSRKRCPCGWRPQCLMFLLILQRSCGRQNLKMQETREATLASSGRKPGCPSQLGLL